MSFIRNLVTSSSRPSMGIESTNAVPFMSTTNCSAPPESPQNKTDPFFGNNGSNSGASSRSSSNATSPTNSQESISFRSYNRQNSDPLHILTANSDKRK